MGTMKEFNTEGPVRPDEHYLIPPLERIDLDEVLGLVRSRKYFALHAPRQTGKTSALLALRDLLNSGAAGDYRCVYANFEVGQAAREDTARALRALLSQLALRAEMTLGDETPGRLRNAALADAGPDGALFEVLSRWTRADPRPLVLLIDEIDTLVGDTLLSVLRQLRAGYDQRPAGFPHSVILCGVRDVRDYRVHSTARNALVLGGSAFNIKSASLRLGDFTAVETRALLAQHTAETGQAFAPAALELIRTRTAGQPWLVNALGREACFDRRPPGIGVRRDGARRCSPSQNCLTVSRALSSMRVGMNHPAAPLPLDAEDRSTLEMWARSATAPHRVVSQAKALLMAGDAVANSRIATALGISRPTVLDWRARRLSPRTVSKDLWARSLRPRVRQLRQASLQRA